MPSWSPAYPTFSFASAPIPPTPFPSGEGGDYKLILPGAPPLAFPRLSRKRHGLNLRGKYPGGGRAASRQGKSTGRGIGQKAMQAVEKSAKW